LYDLQWQEQDLSDLSKCHFKSDGAGLCLIRQHDDDEIGHPSAQASAATHLRIPESMW
jgi:hypothetical protein